MAQPSPAERRIAQKAYAEHLRATTVANRELARVLRDAASEGERIVGRIIGDNVSQQVRRAQLNQAVLALRESQASLWDNVTSATQKGMDRAARAAAESNIELIEMISRSAPGNAQTYLDMTRAGARRTTDAVRSRVLHNHPLSDRVYKTRALSGRWVEREIGRGLALGKSAREIAGSVKHMINPNTPGGVSYAAKRLARTEINNAYHTTQVRSAQALPWTEGLKWELSGSHPTPDICDDLAEADDYRMGEGVYPPSAAPDKPHPQCLCYVVTEVPSTDKFIGSLLNGEYDGWLQSEGFVALG